MSELVKSKQRVADHGEVFTPSYITSCCPTGSVDTVAARAGSTTHQLAGVLLRAKEVRGIQLVSYRVQGELRGGPAGQLSAWAR